MAPLIEKTDKSRGRLRVAVLMGTDEELRPWGKDLANKLLANSETFEEPIVIVVEARKARQSVQRSGGRLSAFLMERLRDLELSKAAKVVAYADYAEHSRQDREFETFRTIHFAGRDCSGVMELDEADRKLLSIEDIDVIVTLGDLSVGPRLRSVAKLGVITCTAADNRAFRGGPSGFWEVSVDAPSSGFTIISIAAGADIARVLFRGNISTETYWVFNYIRVQKKALHFLLKVLGNIAQTGRIWAPNDDIVVYSTIVRSQPSLLCLVRYVSRSHVALAFSRLRKAVLRRAKYNWSISWIKAQGSDVVLADATTITNPHGSFLADPFVIETKEGVFCFAEEYFEEQGKGAISAFAMTDDGVKSLGVVLEEPFHLSYPYVFKDGENIYMIPEASRSGAIGLYKASKFPMTWEFLCPLMENVRAVDTVVFKSDGCWYMLTNFCSAGLGDNTSELHLFSSRDLLNGQWVASEFNPVVFDSRCARNGGFFEEDGRLYRVNQIQGKAHYGKGCTINEIVKIDRNVYEEKPVLTILPEFFPAIKSTHHFHKAAGYVVFDHQ